MRGMLVSVRWGLVAIILAGCGRIGYDDSSGGDAQGSADPYAQAVLANRPAAYFRLDEVSGPTAHSLVGTYTATYQGWFGFGAAGIAGNACARFDNATTRLVLGDVFPFAGNAPHSLEAWVNPAEAFSDTRFIFHRGPGEGYTIYTGGTYTLYSRSTMGTEFCYAGGPQLTPNVWTHVVATYDGAVSRLYINGVEVGSNSGMPGPIGQIATPLVVGDSADGQYFKFHGCIDEVAIYDHALSASDVSAHHAVGAP